jgi:hypothetical protein
MFCRRHGLECGSPADMVSLMVLPFCPAFKLAGPGEIV